METQNKSQQRKLNNALQSIKVMLANKKRSLQTTEWHRLIELTKQSIISNPYQYFDSNLPDQARFKAMIDNIFQKFIADQSIRKKNN